MCMYFIIDPTRIDTRTSDKRDYIAEINSIPELIFYLEGLVQRKFGMNRKQWIQDQSDYVGYTEDSDEVFYDILKLHKIRTGIIRHGNLVDCDVLREHKYSSLRSEFGD